MPSAVEACRFAHSTAANKENACLHEQQARGSPLQGARRATAFVHAPSSACGAHTSDTPETKDLCSRGFLAPWSTSFSRHGRVPAIVQLLRAACAFPTDHTVRRPTARHLPWTKQTLAASINGSCVQDPFLALANACRNKLPLYVMSNLPEHTEQPPVPASVSPRLLRLRVKVAEWLSEVPTTIVTPLAKLCTVKEKNMQLHLPTDRLA